LCGSVSKNLQKNKTPIIIGDFSFKIVHFQGKKKCFDSTFWSKRIGKICQKKNECYKHRGQGFFFFFNFWYG